MNWKLVENIAKNTDKKWYLNQGEVAVILGKTSPYAGAFLSQYGVPFYRIGKEKKFFLPEVIEAIEKTRWKEV